MQGFQSAKLLCALRPQSFWGAFVICADPHSAFVPLCLLPAGSHTLCFVSVCKTLRLTPLAHSGPGRLLRSARTAPAPRHSLRRGEEFGLCTLTDRMHDFLVTPSHSPHSPSEEPSGPTHFPSLLFVRLLVLVSSFAFLGKLGSCFRPN